MKFFCNFVFTFVTLNCIHLSVNTSYDKYEFFSTMTNHSTLGVIYTRVDFYNPASNWYICKYCLKCPSFNGSDGDESYFSPCPEFLNQKGELELLLRSNDQPQAQTDGIKYISEYIGFHGLEVVNVKRDYMGTGDHKEFTIWHAVDKRSYLIPGECDRRCDCIRRMHLQFRGTVLELEDYCRMQLTTERPDVRSKSRLFLCWSPEQRRQLERNSLSPLKEIFHLEL